MDNFSSPLVMEAERALQRAIDTHCDEAWVEALDGCVPLLASLLEAHHERPMDDLLRIVRAILTERCQPDEGGDAVLHDQAALTQQARIVTREMERLRCQWVHRGQWSSVPAPPPMCG